MGSLEGLNGFAWPLFGFASDLRPPTKLVHRRSPPHPKGSIGLAIARFIFAIQQKSTELYEDLYEYLQKTRHRLHTRHWNHNDAGANATGSAAPESTGAASSS